MRAGTAPSTVLAGNPPPPCWQADELMPNVWLRAILLARRGAVSVARGRRNRVRAALQAVLSTSLILAAPDPAKAHSMPSVTATATLVAGRPGPVITLTIDLHGLDVTSVSGEENPDGHRIGWAQCTRGARGRGASAVHGLSRRGGQPRADHSAEIGGRGLRRGKLATWS